MSRDELRAARGIGVALLISAVLLFVYFLCDHPILLTLIFGDKVTSGLIGATPYASMPHIWDIVRSVSFTLDFWPGYEPNSM
jgi:hypothetical protein